MRRSASEDEERDEDEDDETEDGADSDYHIALQDLSAGSRSLIAQITQLAPHSPPGAEELRSKLYASQTDVRWLSFTLLSLLIDCGR